MVFSSGLFLFYFFPIFLLGYMAIPVRFKNGFALLASALFYAWGAPAFLPWVVAGVLADFFIGKKIYQEADKKRSLRWLWLGIGLNLALLLYFKYVNFFVENVSSLLGMNPEGWIKVALPIGISFFTFQKMSYLIDLYRKEAEPADNLLNYALYVLLFPQLIAGPIVRYKEIASQIVDRKERVKDVHERMAGLTRFVLGLGKKVLIADVLGRQVDLYFGQEDLSSPTAWIILLAYAMQIYFDFSGYSDMAIGIGRMLGFVFPENFRFPYLSQSMTEFWRRWHITLSNWMRDYLYIPLGGNRGSKQRTYLNLWLVFLISGLWHGASWNFVIWGAIHGTFLTLDRIRGGNLWAGFGKFPKVALTFFVVLLSWVVFRADDLGESMMYYGQLFAFEGTLASFDLEFWSIFMIGLGLTLLPAIPFFHTNYLKLWERNTALVYNFGRLFLILLLLVLSTSEVMISDYSPFIYFRF